MRLREPRSLTADERSFRNAKLRSAFLILYKTFADLAAKGALFLVTIVAARRLSPQAFGVFALGSTLGWICAVATDFGIQLHLARAVARRPQDAAPLLASWLRVRLWTAAAGLTIVVIGCRRGWRGVSVRLPSPGYACAARRLPTTSIALSRSEIDRRSRCGSDRKSSPGPYCARLVAARHGSACACWSRRSPRWRSVFVWRALSGRPDGLHEQYSADLPPPLASLTHELRLGSPKRRRRDGGMSARGGLPPRRCHRGRHRAVGALFRIDVSWSVVVRHRASRATTRCQAGYALRRSRRQCSPSCCRRCAAPAPGHATGRRADHDRRRRGGGGTLGGFRVAGAVGLRRAVPPCRSRIPHPAAVVAVDVAELRPDASARRMAPAGVLRRDFRDRARRQRPVTPLFPCVLEGARGPSRHRTDRTAGCVVALRP